MPLWTDKLMEEIDELSPEAGTEPPVEAGKYDHVVGFLDEDLRGLYRLIGTWEKALLEKIVQARFTRDEEVLKSYTREVAVLKGRYQAAIEVFWASVRNSFDLWDKDVGIRKGWQVVYTDDSLESRFDALHQLFKMFDG